MIMASERNTDFIRIDGVSHTFQTATGNLPVLDDLNLSVPKNGFTAIVGPSGCGKSTVTRLVAGLLRPNIGGVWVKGEPVNSPRDIVGMAFQNPVLLELNRFLANLLSTVDKERHTSSRELLQQVLYLLLSVQGLLVARLRYQTAILRVVWLLILVS